MNSIEMTIPGGAEHIRPARLVAARAGDERASADLERLMNDVVAKSLLSVADGGVVKPNASLWKKSFLGNVQKNIKLDGWPIRCDIKTL